MLTETRSATGRSPEGRSAAPARPVGATLSEARVVAAGSDGEVVVNDGRGDRPARRAASCLVAPRPGDRVLASVNDLGEAFVVSVLERALPAALQIEPSDTDDMVVTAGRLRLVGRSRLALVARTLRLHAGTTAVHARLVRLVGEAIAGVAGTLQLTARRLERYADQAVEVARTSTRVVDGIDTHRAGTLVQQTEGVATLTSGQTVLTARKEVRIDGERIVMG